MNVHCVWWQISDSEHGYMRRCEVMVRILCNVSPREGGGGTQVQRGAAPALRISRKKGSFLRPPHVRDFVKEGYFFVPRYEVWGSKSPYNPRNIRGSDAE